MRVTLEVQVEVNPRWFREAVPLSCVPGKFEEAKADLAGRVNAIVLDVLRESPHMTQTGNWYFVTSEPRIKRRIANGNRLRRRSDT